MIDSRDLGCPLGWTTKKTRHIFSVLNGATPQSTAEEFWDGDIYWATPEDIGALSGKVLTDTRRKITAKGYKNSGTQLAPVGSIVLTTRAPVGNLALAGVPLCTNQGCRTLVPKQTNTNTDFFYYQLLARKEELEVLATGTTFKELGTDELKTFPLSEPPQETQVFISGYLDRETSRIDSLIATKERLIKLLAEKRRALINQAVTKGFNPNAPLRDSGVRWLGEIPRHWVTLRLALLFRERDERSEPNLPLLEVSINSGVVIREFFDDQIESVAADFNTYKVARKNDIVFNKMRMWQGAVGVSPQDGLVSPDYTVAAPIGALTPVYAGLLFRIEAFSAECARYSHGIVWDRLRLYWEGFRDIVVPIPPKDEQEQIVNHLYASTGEIDTLVKATESTVALLKERRTALITAAVTGTISLPEN